MPTTQMPASPGREEIPTLGLRRAQDALSSQAPPNPLSGAQRFHRRVQRDRSIAITVAAIAAIIAHVAGFVVLDVREAFGLLAFAYGTSLLFFYVHSTRWADRNEKRVASAWIACDIGIVTSLIFLTGGVASPWFLWYLACAGAAALVGGLRWVIAVAATSAAAYVGVLMAMGEIRGFEPALYYAVAQITFLFGASSSLILGTTKLRTDHGKIKRLQDSETIKVWELSLLTTELDAANARLRETTVTDPLTGLNNRRYLHERMAGRRDRQSRVQHGATGVLLIDLDHFKSVNDNHGHHSGDQVLCHVADLLRRCVRNGDSVVRWGGEEFLVLLAQSTTERTSEIVQRILLAVRSEPCSLASLETLHLSCSIGWSELPAADAPFPHATWETVVQHADRALYMAKAAGRDRACASLPRLEAQTEGEIAAHLDSEAEFRPRRISTRG